MSRIGVPSGHALVVPSNILATSSDETPVTFVNPWTAKTKGVRAYGASASPFRRSPSVKGRAERATSSLPSSAARMALRSRERAGRRS